jgi:hypothetical protein
MKNNFSRQILTGLLQASEPGLRELQETYSLLPATRCRRSTHCCSMLPEMTLLEVLAAVQLLATQSSRVRQQLINNIVSYFFINPAMITACPFLAGQDCLVYHNRFFGCRAYGLWSQEYYNSLAGHSREVKKAVQQQWRELGVCLPQQMIDFQVPYCSHVETVGDSAIDDEKLSRIADTIETLSEQCADWHQIFNQNYFADLSFLTTSLIFGVTGAIQIKFTLVRDLITTGDQTRLDKILADLPDPFTEAA